MNEDDTLAAARAHFCEGVDAYQAGRLAAAEAAFTASLRALPGRPSSLMNLAATLTRLRRPAQALPLLDQALAAEPESADALCHRGAAHAALGRPEAALADYDQALCLQPGLVAARLRRAVQLNLLDRPAHALADLAEVTARTPRDGEAWFHHGQTLQALGRVEEALASYDRALALAPGVASVWSRRGTLLKDLGRLAEAARSFQQALVHGGDVDLHRYFLASVSGGELPQAAPRAYVEQLFDRYAADFDEHLVSQLGYRTPQLLAALLPAGQRFDRALDLGCGTGLMAPLLAPVCAAVDGVDLSAQMLDKARAGGLYRHLHHGDLAEHLHATAERFDLVVAADVFVYIGALDAVFAGASRVLASGGVFMFSVEVADGGPALQLRPSARYAHSQSYVEQLAICHGFGLHHLEPQTLRHDQGRPVAGLLMRLVRR